MPTCQGLDLLQGSSRVHSSHSTTAKENTSAAGPAFSPDITSGACTRQKVGQATLTACRRQLGGQPHALLARIDKLGLHAAYQPAGVRSRHAAGIWRGRVQQLGQVQVTDLQARCNMAGSGDKSPAVHSQQMMFCTHSPQQSLLLESSAASAEQALRQRHSVVCHFPLQSICHLPIRLET